MKMTTAKLIRSTINNLGFDGEFIMKFVIVSEFKKEPGTREFKLIEKGEALFHGFGVNYEEFENGPGNFSAAIVEWPSGQVELVPAEFIRFVVPNAQVNPAGAASPVSEANEGST